jgi:CAAX protease family protein
MKSRAAATLYVCLALGFSALYWLLVVTFPEAMKKSEWAVASTWGTVAWAVLRAFGPAVAGVIALAVIRGRGAVVELGRSLVRWRVAPRLYLFALFPAILNAIVILLGGLHFAPQIPIAKAVIFFFLMALIDGPLGEEVGWRGVLLPQLLETMRPLTASVIVGVVWYLWHVPLYAADGKGMGVADHALFALSCVALSVIYTWFWQRSNGSTLFAIFLHNCSNYFIFLRVKLFTPLGPSPWPRAVYFTLLFALALLLGIRQSRQAGQPALNANHACTPGAS